MIFVRLLLLFNLSAALCCGGAMADSASETAVETAFMYNFFRYIDWPDSANKFDDFSLCTTDNEQLGNSLSVLENKTINGKPLIIRRGLAGKELKKCQMVFIANSGHVTEVIRELKGLPIVTVSEGSGFIDQGGIIGFVQNDNRLGFEINQAVANVHGLHISAQILKLAKRVNIEK